MRALICSELGPADQLSVREVPDPEPGSGEIVLDVQAAGLNFPDTLIIQGNYQFRPDLPFVPGGEAAGVVSAVGADVTRFSVGDEVIAMAVSGAFAEKWAVDANAVIPKPASLDFENAAGFGLTYGTSYYALKQRAGLQPGESLLVLGAAGGVGSSAVDIGKAMGARVIAAASTDQKLSYATRLGADDVINYSTEDLRDRIRDLTDGTGVDVVYDPVGGDLAETTLRSMAWNGRFLVVGFAAGSIPEIPLNLPLLKGVSIVGVFWGAWTKRDPAGLVSNFAELFAMVEQGRLSPQVSAAYPLERYVEAFGALTGRKAMGKVIFEISGD
jgi:NADPH2:quinone reductase